MFIVVYNVCIINVSFCMSQFGSLNLTHANKILPTLKNMPKSKYEYTRLSQKLNLLNNQVHYLKENMRRILNDKFAEPEVYLLSLLLELKDEFTLHQNDAVRYIETAQLLHSFPTTATSVKRTNIDFMSSPNQNQASFFSSRVLTEEIKRLEEVITNLTDKHKKVLNDLREFQGLLRFAKIEQDMKTLNKGGVPNFIHQPYPSRAIQSQIKLAKRRAQLAEVKKEYDLLAIQLIPEFATRLEIAKKGFTEKEMKLFRKKFKFPSVQILTESSIEMVEIWEEQRRKQQESKETKPDESNNNSDQK